MAPKKEEPPPPPVEAPGWEPPPLNPQDVLQSNGEHPLVSAAAAGNVPVLTKLLQQGVSPDVQNVSGLSALAAAALNGNVGCIQELLAAGATVDLAGGHSGSTPLLLATRGGHRGCCEVLLQAGADAARTDEYGESPKMAAHRYEVDAKRQSSELERWAGLVHTRAALIAGEPPPPVPPFPEWESDFERYYRSTDPAKALWRAGAWMHQKRPACGPVIEQARPRAFSSTGYKVPPVLIGEERFTIGPPTYHQTPGHTVLSGERLASQAALYELRGAAGELAANRLSLERTTLNPQVFGDDVASTHKSMRHATSDAAGQLRAVMVQEAHLGRKFPSAPTRLGPAALYSSGLQRTMMSLPTAATTMYPNVETAEHHFAKFPFPYGEWNQKPHKDSLTALLENFQMVPPAEPAAA